MSAEPEEQTDRPVLTVEALLAAVAPAAAAVEGPTSRREG
jgi:hypothetical protein